MTAKELIKQYVDTGIQLPEYQVNKLNNQDKKTYLRKRLLTVKDSVEALRMYEINLLSKGEQDKYLLSLSDYKLIYFMQNSEDIESDIDRLLSLNGFIDNLDSDVIDSLLYHAKYKKHVINKLLLSDELIGNLNSSAIHSLIVYNDDKEYVIDKLLTSDKFIRNLTSSGIHHLFYYIKDSDIEEHTNKLIKRGVSKDLINTAINSGLYFNNGQSFFKNNI
jgi:hypothetical protein